MASVRIDGDTLHIEFSGWDKLWAVHGSFALPLANVAGATTEKPPSFWEALKIIGTGSIWPFKMAGTFLYHGEVVFFDYQGEARRRTRTAVSAEPVVREPLRRADAGVH